MLELVNLSNHYSIMKLEYDYVNQQSQSLRYIYPLLAINSVQYLLTFSNFHPTNGLTQSINFSLTKCTQTINFYNMTNSLNKKS